MVKAKFKISLTKRLVFPSEAFYCPSVFQQINHKNAIPNGNTMRTSKMRYVMKLTRTHRVCVCLCAWWPKMNLRLGIV